MYVISKSVIEFLTNSEFKDMSLMHGGIIYHKFDTERSPDSARYKFVIECGFADIQSSFESHGELIWYIASCNDFDDMQEWYVWIDGVQYYAGSRIPKKVKVQFVLNHGYWPFSELFDSGNDPIMEK